MELDFNNETTNVYNTLEDNFNYFLDKVVKFLNLSDNYYIEVNIVDEETIKSINSTYRHIDKVTDVISFAFDDEVEGDKSILNPIIHVLGDIFICDTRAKKQSIELNQSLEREMCFLFVHGLLHLLGYDHMCKEDEEVMFKIQKDIFEGENL